MKKELLAAFFGQYVTPAAYTVVENSLFHENATGAQQGGAIVGITASESPRLVFLNCTIADNSTGGVRSDVEGWPAIVYNSIVWNNGPYEISPDCDEGAFVYYSDVMGDTGCEGFVGNIANNPIFAESSYELTADSPCIGMADSSSAPPTDINGEYRDTDPDMGAFEFFDGGLGD